MTNSFCTYRIGVRFQRKIMPRSPDNEKAKVKVYCRIDPELKEWGLKNGVNFSRSLEQKLREEKEKMSTTYLGYQVQL